MSKTSDSNPLRENPLTADGFTSTNKQGIPPGIYQRRNKKCHATKGTSHSQPDKDTLHPRDFTTDGTNPGTIEGSRYCNYQPIRLPMLSTNHWEKTAIPPRQYIYSYAIKGCNGMIGEIKLPLTRDWDTVYYQIILEQHGSLGDLYLPYTTFVHSQRALPLLRHPTPHKDTISILLQLKREPRDYLRSRSQPYGY